MEPDGRPFRTVAFAAWLYRRAVARSPASFAPFREQAAADFERVAARERAERGRGAVLLALARALADLAARAPAEMRHDLRRREGVATMWMREATNAARALARRPFFSGVVLGTLAMGIGATVTIFTVVDAILIRPLPYPESERIVSLNHHAPGLDLPELQNSPGMGRFYLESAPFLEHLALTQGGLRNLTGLDRPERVTVVEASPSLFDVLGVEPFLGRRFTPEEGRPEGASGVVVLTHASWTRKFGGDRDVLGRTLEMDGVPHEIVGVMPEGFAYATPEVAAYVPYVLAPDAPFGTFGMGLLARLPEEMELADARRQIESLQPRVPEFFESLTPEFLEQAGWAVTVHSLKEDAVGDVRTALWVVLGTVAFVLLIACANVANLFLVRAELRQRELAIRAALGAGRGRLVVAYMAESLVLGLAAGALALVASWAGVEALVAAGPDAIPRLHEVSVGWRTAVFTLAVSVLAGVALGALPVVRYLGSSFAALLRSGGRGATEGKERHRTRNVLVAAQLALALVLLVGSGLMLRSFQRLRSVDPGFDPAGVLAVGLSVGGGRERAEAARFYQRVVDEARALPGVRSVGVANAVPVQATGGNGGSFAIESRPRAENELPPVAMNVTVAGSFFETLGIPLVRGRSVQAMDHEGSERPVAWVNQAFVDQFLEDADPLTERVGFADEGPFMDIVGVVGDTRHFGLREPVRPMIYVPMAPGVAAERGQVGSVTVLLDTELADPTTLTSSVREIVQRLDGQVPITATDTMDGIVAESMADTSFTLVLLGIAAGMALLLGAVGIFGVISYVVSQRTREIGVRMALGAEPGAVRSMVVRQGMAVAAVGIAVGLGGAFALTRWMESLLFEVSTTDPGTFAAVSVGLAAVAALASYLPARRASRVDPVRALTTE